MKKGQSVITLIFKEDNSTYLFGSLSAIYGMFTSDELGFTYPSLRNAVSSYVKDNHVDESGMSSVVIFNTDKFVLLRAPLLLVDKTEEKNKVAPSTEIDELYIQKKISIRLYNVLKSVNIGSVEELSMHSRAAVSKLRRVGETLLNEMDSLLESRGLHFSDC